MIGMFGTIKVKEKDLEKNEIGKWLRKYLHFSICQFLAQDAFSTPGLFDNFAQHEILYKMVSKHRSSIFGCGMPLWKLFGSYKKSVLKAKSVESAFHKSAHSCRVSVFSRFEKYKWI